MLISAYNPGQYFRASLESVLAQTHRDTEVLVVDDGSTDGAVEQAKAEFTDERIRWFRQENSGKSVALNFGLRELRGAYYAIHDADDVMHPERIAKQAEALDSNTDLAAVFCGHELLINNRPVAPRFRAKDRDACRWDIEQFRMPAHDPTVMFRVSAVRGMEYEPELRIGQGYDYVLRVGEQWPMVVLGETLYQYRIDLTSITRKDPMRRRSFVDMARRRACERRGLKYEELFPPKKAAPVRNRDRDNFIATDFIESVLDLRTAGRTRECMLTGLRCASIHPLDAYYYKALMYAIAPWSLVRRVRAKGMKRRRMVAVT